MSVSQVVRVQFGPMSSNLTEFATLTLDGLDSLPDFQTHQGSFDCVVVDRERTRVTLTELISPALETAVSITASFRGGDDPAWMRLVSVEGFAEQSQTLLPDLGDVYEAGERALETLILSEDPTMTLRVEAEVPDALEALEIELELVLFFSTEAARCVERRALPEPPQGESSSPDSL